VGRLDERVGERDDDGNAGFVVAAAAVTLMEI
jgi:hypothetical protein